VTEQAPAKTQKCTAAVSSFIWTLKWMRGFASL
jgi:hypothetical protein